jgi:hypothetical protein
MLPALECPHCHYENQVPESAIGQYVPCVRCRCRFYVPVPPLDLEGSAAKVPAASTSPAARSLESHQGEGRVMMRQEALQAALLEELVRVRRGLTVVAVLALALLAALVALLATG